MPIYYSSQSLDNQYLGANQILTAFQGNKIVQGNYLPVIGSGLVSFYDFQNSYSYPGTGTQAYSLLSLNQLTNPVYTGSIDAIFSPPTASSVVESGSLGKMLYYPNKNGYNNFRMEPGYSTILYDWTVVVACKYLDLPSGAYPYASIFSAQSNASTNHYVRYNSGSLGMEIYIDNISLGSAVGPFDLNEWHIVQIAVSGSGNPQLIWNIDNVATGSAYYAPNLVTDIVNKKFTQNQIVTDNGGGKGYLQVMGLYNRQLTADEMAYNFTLLNTRYGI